MSTDNDQAFTEISDAAKTFTQLLPLPAAVGGLMMLYDGACRQGFTHQQLSDCFGDENIDVVGFAYSAAAEYWQVRHHGAQPTWGNFSLEEFEAKTRAATETSVMMLVRNDPEDLP